MNYWKGTGSDCKVKEGAESKERLRPKPDSSAIVCILRYSDESIERIQGTIGMLYESNGCTVE
jgi:hypothetical protein